MSSNGEFSDTDSLNRQAILATLSELGATWSSVEIFESIDSTNAEVNRRLAQFALQDPLAIVAEEQTEGLGRLGRSWSTDYGTGIALSLGFNQELVRQVPSALPLQIGSAVVAALAKFEVSASLKWPNDIVFLNSDNSVRKCGGILVQQISDTYIVGIGINVLHTRDQLPTEIATSLLLEGFKVSPNELIAHIIFEVESALQSSADWHAKYLGHCATIGNQVAISQLTGPEIQGIAIGITENGALIIQTDSAIEQVTIGDVQHAALQS